MSGTMISKRFLDLWAETLAHLAWVWVTGPADSLARFNMFVVAIRNELMQQYAQSQYQDMATFKPILQNMDGYTLRGIVLTAMSSVGITSTYWYSLNYNQYAMFRDFVYRVVDRTDLDAPASLAGGVTKIELAEVLISFAEDFLTDRTGPKVLVNGVLKPANLAERQAYWTPEFDDERGNI